MDTQSPFCFCSVGAKAHVRPLSAVHALLMDAHRGSITTSIAALKRARETARAGVGRVLELPQRKEVNHFRAVMMFTCSGVSPQGEQKSKSHGHAAAAV
jgi:hypothetical protein